MAAGLAIATAPAWAGTFVAMTRHQLVERADSVIVGRVAAVEPYWDEEHGVIVSEAVIEVEKKLVGETPEVIRVKTWGGRIGNTVIEASGMPKFQKGERQLLFLYTRPGEQVPRVLGYQQGQFRIVEAQDGTEIAKSAVEDSVVILGPDREPAFFVSDVPLARLEQEILDLARSVRPANRQPVRK
ncbi:MAG TPA: hypothetical protein VGX68_16430 [Thermoanaerobaculia bacterium]|jgi:hypothetical protein|nr:hypothetical protein [Thermoanaerobaculia bacterium]